MIDSSEPGVLGVGEIAQASGDHIPRLSSAETCFTWDSSPNCEEGTGLWLRHDIGEVRSCGPGRDQVCSWYSGTGTPGVNQVDAWGVSVEEVGHVRNISHHIPPNHSTSHGHAMDGGLCFDDPASCTMDNRLLTFHEREHACLPYRLEHSSC